MGALLQYNQYYIIEYMYAQFLLFFVVVKIDASKRIKGRRGRDSLVVRFTPTFAISAYHH